ncbi:MAG: tRNA uridine-5-carboxymethylaminomethyl(34) synthesis GTPase MnmE, partial [Victivallales bacterium]|nr:tRNA uridine-5-carboxymethylaminomethyl(34) synthesis GTPase MnmE [Victivallales bacterium]
MTTFQDHTICALATAAGGPVAIIRISGSQALESALKFWQGRSCPEAAANHRKLLMGTFRAAEGAILDQQCLLVYMPGPASYTGEDVVELHIHGGAVSCRRILNQLLGLPEVQLAEAGEFTRRAFINGRLDLTQAEAVADLLGAESEAAMNLANRQLAGALGCVVNTMYDQLREILAESESHLDFPEEELEWQSTGEMTAQLQEISRRLRELIATRREGEVLRDGVTLAIAGAPNAGKSSLLNRLLGRERAIVSPIPGTTRDTVEAELVLRGIPLHLVDTAGIREADDTIEANGIQRARQACAEADIVLWITDAASEAPALWPE